MADPEPISISEFRDPEILIASCFEETFAQARIRVAREQAEAEAAEEAEETEE